MTDNVRGYHWRSGDHKHEVDYCLKLARAAGAITSTADRTPHLYVDPLAHQQLEQLLEREGIVPEKPFIVCHISSNNGQSKRWPIPYWAILIDKLIRGQNAQVILSGAVSPTATVLRSDIWCSPCYNAKDSADCRFFTTQCMKNILPSQVFKVAQEKLT